MAMARVLSQSVPRAPFRSLTALIGHQRHGSNKAHGAHLIELDPDAAASSSLNDSTDSSAGVIAIGISRLEDAIHGIIVRRAAPDWLPFLPGFSYWMPRRRSRHGGRIGKLGFSGKKSSRILPEDQQQMSLTSTKGWPSSTFFIQGSSSPMQHPLQGTEMEVNAGDSDYQDETNGSEECVM